MLKLIKILGSTSNVPEPVKLRTDRFSQFKKGSAYYVVNGVAVGYGGEGSDIRFVSLESLPEEHGQEEIWGYYLTKDMIFEADTVYTSNADALAIGKYIGLSQSIVDSGFDVVEENDTYEVIILDFYKENNQYKAIVSFNM